VSNRTLRWRWALGGSLLGALALWLSIAALSPGYVADIESRKARAKWVTEQGIADAYRMRIDYPPGNLYLFAAVGQLYRQTVDPTFDHRRASDSQLLTFLIKLPPTLFHLATGLVVFLVVRRAQSERLAWLAASLLLFDPAAIFDVAHQGQYDPVHTFFSLAAIAALLRGWSVGAGASIALAALTKPQSWILLPFVAALAWRLHGRPGLARLALGAAGATVVGLLPFILANRLAHLGRLWEYMSTNSTANHVISANAHNLWWLPTVGAGRWIDDVEPLAFGLSYRAVAIGLVGLVLLASLAWLLRGRGTLEPFALAAALASGWFMFTPRAHEYHAFFVLPFLAVAWPSRPRLLPFYLLCSVSLLLNLGLHDPLLVGALASPPDPATPLPSWYLLLTVANVVMFVVLWAGLELVNLRGAGKRRGLTRAELASP
jgi:dolichyl-phosphate-mannose-protein mannosyltransferase